MDLNGDGIDDVISGSWPGEIWFFAGEKTDSGRCYRKGVMLLDENGAPINPGGGIEEQNDERILIAGTVVTEESQGEKLLRFGGRTLKIPSTVALWTTGTACAAHAADWDADGDFDLITGDIEGNLWFIENRGDAKTWSFAKERALKVGAGPARVPGDAGPFVVDFDADGDLDLLSGAGDGSVTFFENRGTRASAELAKGVVIVPRGSDRSGPNAPKEPLRGTRSKLCATDWNGDGVLDLLVGDYATMKPDRPEPTDEEKIEHQRLREERNEVWRRYRERGDALQQLLKQTLYSALERERIETEQQALLNRYQELDATIPKEDEPHGWVWLFLGRPPQRSAPRDG